MLSNEKLFYTILAIIIIILLVFYISYLLQFEPYKNTIYKKKHTLIELYFSPTCGHCNIFKNEWKKLVEKQLYTCNEYNCQNGECNSDIKYVPLLKINNTIYEGDMTCDYIIQYINKMN